MDLDPLLFVFLETIIITSGNIVVSLLYYQHKFPKLGLKNPLKPEVATKQTGSLCVECGQQSPNHLETCSLSGRKEEVIPVTKYKPRIPHCSKCGELGHYRSKCPNKEKKQDATSKVN